MWLRDRQFDQEVYIEEVLKGCYELHMHVLEMAKLVKPVQHVYCEHCCKFVSRKTRYNHQSRKKTGTPIQDIDERTENRKRRRQHLDLYLRTSATSLDVSAPKQCRIGEVVLPHTLQDEQETVQEVKPSSPCSDRFKDFAFLSDTEADSIDEPNSSACCLESLDGMTEDMDASQSSEEFADRNYNDDSMNASEEFDTSEDSFTDLPSESEEPLQQRAAKIVSWVLTSLFSIQLTHNVSDAALLKFLLLLSQIFTILSPFSFILGTLGNLFPKSLYKARKLLNLKSNDFTKYVVCKKCCALYSFEKVVKDQTVKKCTNMVFSCRSAAPSRKKGKVKCDTLLVDEIVHSDNTKSVTAKKIYCYQGIIDSLQRFLLRPNFIEKCNSWRHRNITPNLYADVYDGEIWQKFYEYNGSDFLTHPYHFGVMLNVDWFQPFQRRQDISIGALYMVFMNLPREVRFKRENCILVGIIPSLPKEPESLNSFLSPLVTELKALWKGVQLNIPHTSNAVSVKMALMCAAADIPAARKLCGFLGHAAIQGCSSCTKPLWSAGVHDCGIPDLNRWSSRNRVQHLKYVSKIKTADCLTKAKEIEKKHGYRYTVLLDLPYFEPSLMTAIDPMHNLFLGTAKKMFSFWVDKEILTKNNLLLLASKIESVSVPSDVGRIPVNISSNYGQMTAKEWKNWVLVYSLICLNGLLPALHLKVWQTFVLACRHFCQPCIDKVNVEIANKLMVKFCTQVSQLYGSQFLTPNMHLHCHLHESVKHFGSMYGFWLFSFERYNGIMSDFHTNRRRIEEQLMKKFMLFSATAQEELEEEFSSRLDQLLNESTTSNVQLSSPELFSVPTGHISNIQPDCWSDLSRAKLKNLCNSSVESVSKQLQNSLCEVYSFMYSRPIPTENVSSVYTKYSSVYFNNESLSSEMSARSDRNSYIFASWADENNALNESSSLRLGRIRHFVHSVVELYDCNPVEHVFAYVDWFKGTSDHFGFLNPVTVWSKKLQNDGPASLLPLPRIYGKAAWHNETRNSQRFIVAVPVPKSSFM